MALFHCMEIHFVFVCSNWIGSLLFICLMCFIVYDWLDYICVGLGVDPNQPSSGLAWRSARFCWVTKKLSVDPFSTAFSLIMKADPSSLTILFHLHLWQPLFILCGGSSNNSSSIQARFLDLSQAQSSLCSGLTWLESTLMWD